MKNFFFVRVILFFFVLFLSSIYVSGQAKDFIITKPIEGYPIGFSGDNQHLTESERIEAPIRVKVTRSDSTPVKNCPVWFGMVSKPEKSSGFSIDFPIVLTDSNGIAATYITLGDKQGEYEISAKIKSDGTENFVIYRTYAKASDWVFILLIGLLGGLGLFLYGMHLMSTGMQKSAGDKMRSILSALTKNRLVALGVGTFVTMIIQSSSATTVMLISFVQAGLMKFARTIAVMLGAAIGTTVTAQLIAFKLTDYSLVLIGVGAAILFFLNNQKIKNIGETVLGFGLLFFGMYVMSEAMYPLRSYEPFVELLLKMENPILGILVGVLFTALIQSSSASIGVMIILASQGLLSLEAAIPLVFGANLGTAVTAILASLNTKREAKKVAYAQTLIKAAGLITFVWWIPQLAEFVEYISPKSTITHDPASMLAEVVPRQIANAHTVFNIVLASISLPLAAVLVKLLDKLFPEKEEKSDDKFRTKYIDYHLIQTPILALNVAKQEAVRMSYTVLNMLKEIILPYTERNTTVLVNIQRKEQKIDFLRDKIKDYLIQISQSGLPKERINESFQILYAIKELEQIADIISTNLSIYAEKWLAGNMEFTEQGKAEIIDYHLRSLKQMSRAIEVFRDVNLEKAVAMKQKHKKYADMEREFERHHFERLVDYQGKSLGSSKTHLELLGMLKMISSHATNIARILLEWAEKEPSKDSFDS